MAIFIALLLALSTLATAAPSPWGGKPYNDSRDEVEKVWSSANPLIEKLAQANRVMAGWAAHPDGKNIWRPHLIDMYRDYLHETNITEPAYGKELCVWCGNYCVLPNHRCCAPQNIWRYAGGVIQCPSDERCTFGSRHQKSAQMCCKVREKDSMIICPDDAEYPDVEMEYYWRKHKNVRQGYWVNHTEAPPNDPKFYKPPEREPGPRWLGGEPDY